MKLESDFVRHWFRIDYNNDKGPAWEIKYLVRDRAGFFFFVSAVSQYPSSTLKYSQRSTFPEFVRTPEDLTLKPKAFLC